MFGWKICLGILSLKGTLSKAISMEFLNYSVFDGYSLSDNQDVIIADSNVNRIGPTNSQHINADIIIPGFIDLQIYGSGGRLFSADPSVENLCHIENDLLRKGTTGFLACIATNTSKVFHRCIEVAKTHRAVAKNCLGLHLEGPFLNPKRRGAHVEEFIRKASLEEVKRLIDFGDGIIKMITIAPELQDDDIIQYLLDQDIVVSLGHSDASFEQATRAYNNGIQTTTHLFNAMSPLQHRAPGVAGAVFNHPKAKASIIVDGLHVDFEMVRISHKLMGERLFLITDAVTECNVGPYQHRLSGDKFVMPDGTLSGSSLTMLQAVKNCVIHCGISLTDALKMSTSIPAGLLGMQSGKGKLKVGGEADFLIIDSDFNLKKVIYNGVEV